MTIQLLSGLFHLCVGVYSHQRITKSNQVRCVGPCDLYPSSEEEQLAWLTLVIDLVNSASRLHAVTPIACLK